MDESSLLNRNPWSDDDRSLGAIRNVMVLAGRTGHVEKGKIPNFDEVQAEASSKFTSMKMIALLKHIDEQKNMIDSMSLDIQRRLQDKETADILHQEELEKKIATVNGLNNHLQSLVGSKDHLVSTLQQPYVGDYIKVEAKYKKYASEIFPMIVPVLSDLSRCLEDIDWASKVDVGDGDMVKVLDDIASSLAALQSNFQAINQVRETTQMLHSQKSE